MDKVVKKKRLIKGKTVRKIKQTVVEVLICAFWVIAIGLTSAIGSYFGAYVYNHGIPWEKMTNEDSVEDNQSCRQASEHSWECNFDNDKDALIGTNAIAIDADNDSFPTPADNTILGVKFNDSYPEVKMSQEFHAPKELRKAILKVIPEEVTVKKLKITEEEVNMSGILSEHDDMDILIENLKTISDLQRFETPSLKPRPGGGVTFNLRIFLTIELTSTNYRDGPEGANYTIDLSNPPPPPPPQRTLKEKRNCGPENEDGGRVCVPIVYIQD